ncbi:MAG: helix-turn-helix transcriptional regulator [Bacteroidetes bacterium]|nr:helix-turn-helix transcriptional regulator [Bacteroidota bacterium]
MMQQKIYNLELLDNGIPASFVLRTMEEIADRQQGIADDPHRHNYYSVIWPFSGSGRHVIDFNEYPILPHHIFFVSPSQVHQIISGPETTGLVLLFTPEFLMKNSIREDFISNLRLFRDSSETPALPLSNPMLQNLQLFAGHMSDAYASGQEMKYETIGAYLKLFLIECNSHCNLFPDTNTQRLEVGKSMVQRFKNLVETHFNQWHQVKDYAGALHVSPNYLNEVIKSNIGTSAKDFIQNRILLEAKRTAVFTGKSSKEIAFELGFDDPSHFSKFFKSGSGQSVLEFKQTHSS